MALIEISPGVYSAGAADWDRKIFDELIPLPDGTSYNAYLIKGKEKTALIDTVDPSKKKHLALNLADSGIKRIDYIISNHAEQDHSGSIPMVLNMYPDAKVAASRKCREFLEDLLPVPGESFITINDGDTLSLGGKTLKFVFTPWVHWPETMVTYLAEERILFSCDFFGAHLASSSPYSAEGEKLLDSAKRYYAEIMMPFRGIISKNIEKLSGLKIDMIAPSHGPVYKNPSFIINAYREWISDDVKNEAVIAYVSMHGSTEEIVSYLVDLLIKKGVGVSLFNMAKSDIGSFAMALTDAATLVLASPTVLSGAHPSVLYAAALVNALRPKTKFVSLISSCGWGGRFAEQMKAVLGNVKSEFLDPVIVKGHPAGDDYVKLERLADEILKRHRDCVC